MREQGSVAPLVAGYLALILITLVGSAAVGVSMIAANRVQAVADAAVLYAHDRSITRGIPDQSALKREVATFLQNAPSAKRINVVNSRAITIGAISSLELCAKVSNPLWTSHQILICKSSRAQSFVTR